MGINLYFNYYVDKEPKRHREIICCLLENLKNRWLNKIIVVISENDVGNMTQVMINNGISRKDQKKVQFKVMEERPSYNYYFGLTRENPDDINIIANTDIVVGFDVKKLIHWAWKNRCLALSRWDYLYDNMRQDTARHHANRDSQDVWIMNGGFKDIPEADFPLGKRGCDNKIAFLLNQHYQVINPSITIKTYHYHITNIRNYAPHGSGNTDLIPPPYHFIKPTILPA